ncbi:MAG: T9SS type A sorting domain-containing protein [Saprospiraceae bacterium]|nr:T9SS type A sorting domain-containing protein [Saprospiraceae bacterium]MBP7679737.1 T9SS type A sorting domain-containing protein [Saprospiraceae bacterium]
MRNTLFVYSLLRAASTPKPPLRLALPAPDNISKLMRCCIILLMMLSVNYATSAAEDLALRVELASGQSQLVTPGSTVTFKITIFNQGTSPIPRYGVYAYPVSGLTFASTPIFTYPPDPPTIAAGAWIIYLGNNEYLYENAAVPIPVGGSHTFFAHYTVNAGAAIGTSFRADFEIEGAYTGVPGTAANQVVDMDSQMALGLPGISGSGEVNAINDEIFNANGDEDDHDFATVFVSCALTAHCPHPAPTGSSFATLDDDGSGVTDYTDAGSDKILGEIDVNSDGDVTDLEDGYIRDLRQETCSTTTPIFTSTVQSGATYGFAPLDGITYTFELCRPAGSVQIPTMDLWQSEAQTSNLLAASSFNAATGCARFTYKECENGEFVFLNVRSHSCISDWANWTLNIYCKTPTLTCPSNVSVSMLNADCNAGGMTAVVTKPTTDVDDIDINCDGDTNDANESDNLTWYYDVWYPGIPTSGAPSLANQTLPSGTSSFSITNPVIGCYTVRWHTRYCVDAADGATTPEFLEDNYPFGSGATGNTFTCTQLVKVIPTLACNNLVNISVGGDCCAQIKPSMLLEGECIATGVNTVQYFVNINMTGSDMACSTTYPLGTIVPVMVSAYFDIDGDGVRDAGEPILNTCNSSILLEDKLPPALTCTSFDVLCGASTLPTAENQPKAVDGCGGTVTLIYVDTETSMGNACSDLNDGVEDGFSLVKSITRKWIGTDQYGNKDSCEQTIRVRRPALNDGIATSIRPGVSIVFPDSRDDVAGLINQLDGDATNDATNANGTTDDAINCAGITYNASGNPIVSDAIAGTPYILIDNLSGTDTTIAISPLCLYSANFNDLFFDNCGTLKKIQRIWTVMDWCNTNSQQIYSNVSDPQIIKIVDVTPPVVSAITSNATITYPINFSCNATVMLPAITATDDCTATANLKVTVSAPGIGTFITTVGASVIFTNVTTGTHTFTYRVEDQCGNIATTTLDVLVEDSQQPIAICESDFIVALTDSGTALAFAQTFDDGSFDNCTSLTGLDMQAQRMGATTFDDYVTFTCADLGSAVPIVFQVTDETGNSNRCMVNVTVQDKIMPRLTSVPADITINCNQNINDLTLTGNAVGLDNCSNVTLTHTDNTSALSVQCGLGIVTRTFQLSDGGGNIVTATQRITIQNTSPLVEAQITWPADVTISCGDNATSSATGVPVFPSLPCGPVSFGYSDLAMNVNGSTASFIERTWTVTDACAQEANPATGTFSHKQRIALVDIVAPVFTPCSTIGCSFTFQILENNGATVQIPAQSAVDNCAAATNITYTYNTINSTTNVLLGTGTGPFLNVPAGTYTTTVTATDPSQNSTTRILTLLVSDTKKPTPICRSGLSTTLMPQADGGGMVVINADFFESGSSSDNCTSFSNLRHRIRRVGEGTGLPATTSITFTCADLAAPSCGLIYVEMWVGDEANNWDYCVTYISVQNNMSACPTPAGCGTGGTVTAMIAGNIFNEEQVMVQDVHVGMEGSAATATTANNGHYELPNLPVNAAYAVIPSNNADPLNGVTTYDLVLISKHILGIEPLDSPYKIIAADVNKSGNITTYDLVQLRQLILHVYEVFPDNQSWRFVNAHHQFSNPANPFVPTIPEVMAVQPLNNDMMDADFIAVKIGDVNNSAIPNGLLGTQDRSTPSTVVLKADEVAFNKGVPMRVPILASEFRNLLGCQFTLTFDTDKLALREVIPTSEQGLSIQNFGLNNTDNGTITFSWNDTQPRWIKDNTVLFTLEFDVKKSGKLSEVLQLNSRLTPAEAYINSANNKITEYGVDLQIGSANVADSAFELYQNVPNPFKAYTVIGFQLPQSSVGTLSIFDADGKLIQEYVGNFTKGYNEIKIEKSEMISRGVLYYKLQTPTHTASKKMVLIE